MWSFHVAGGKEDEIIRQTANYQLPLWDAADRILRADFNQSSQNADQAIAAVRTEAAAATEALRAEAASATEELRAEIPTAKLADVTTTAAANVVRLQLGSLDLTQYHFVQLYVNCPLVGKQLYIRVNGLETGYRYLHIGGSGGGGATQVTYLFDARPRPSCPAVFNIGFNQIAAGTYVGGTCFSSNDSNYNTYNAASPCKWEDLTSFDLSAVDGTILPAGTRLALYGTK